MLLQTAIKDPRPVEKHIIEMEYKNLLEDFAPGKSFLNKNGLTQKDVGKVKKDIERQIRVKRLIEKLHNQAGEISEKEATDPHKSGIHGYSVDIKLPSSSIRILFA